MEVKCYLFMYVCISTDYYHSRGKHTAQELGYTAIEDRRVLVLNRGMRVEQNHLDVVKI